MSRPLSSRYRHAFVTGASSGIGRAFTEMLLAEGVRVWGTSRDVSRLAPLTASRAFTPVALDLDDPAGVDTAFARAADEANTTGTTADALGRAKAFDLVINNAGYGLFSPFASTLDFSAWQAQLDAMLTTTMRLAHAAVRGMVAQRRGCLVNISSLAAEFPLPYMSGYNVAKAGLSAFSESLMFELRGSGVAVIDFRPGDYRTGFNQVMQPAALSNEAAALRSGTADTERIAATWRALDTMFNQAPAPARAARDLRRVLLRGRSGTVRSGSFFQACLAPLAMRLMPAALRRAAIAHYFGAT